MAANPPVPTTEPPRSSSTTSTKPTFALTTIFVPPASCTENFTKSGSVVWQGGIMQTVDNGCFPPNFLGIFNSAYSPGVCPQGWTSAASLPAGSAVQSTQTNMMCCPRGYFMSKKRFDSGTNNPSDGGLFCASTVASTATISNVFTTTALKPGAVPTNQGPQAIRGAEIADGLVWADIIQVRWGSQDGGVISLMREQASPATTSTTKTTAGPPQTQTSGPTETGRSGEAPPASTGLSGGVIAGVVAGVLAGLILGGLAVWFLFKKRRQGREQMAYGGNEKPWAGRPDAELAAAVPAETDGTPSTVHGSAYTASSPGHGQKMHPDGYAPSSQQYGQSPHGPPSYVQKLMPGQPPAELLASVPEGWRR